MNELITTEPQTLVEIVDRYCGQCGNAVVPQDRFCRNCGTECHVACSSVGLVPVMAESCSANALPAQQRNGQGGITVQTVLNNRLMVIGIVALIGPLGLPAVWFCPRFNSTTKILITTFYLLLTAIVPIVVVWYVLEDSFQPLVEAFGVLPSK